MSTRNANTNQKRERNYGTENPTCFSNHIVKCLCNYIHSYVNILISLLAVRFFEKYLAKSVQTKQILAQQSHLRM